MKKSHYWWYRSIKQWQHCKWLKENNLLLSKNQVHILFFSSFKKYIQYVRLSYFRQFLLEGRISWLYHVSYVVEGVGTQISPVMWDNTQSKKSNTSSKCVKYSYCRPANQHWYAYMCTTQALELCAGKSSSNFLAQGNNMTATLHNQASNLNCQAGRCSSTHTNTTTPTKSYSTYIPLYITRFQFQFSENLQYKEIGIGKLIQIPTCRYLVEMGH